MLMIGKSKKTEWEKLEALKQEKINSKANLEKQLEDAIEMQREALLKGDEGKRQEALAMVQSLQQQIAAVDRDIKFLEEEQSKVEAMHIEFKLKEIERQKEAIRKELEPYQKAYEDAKTAFRKAEQEWFTQYQKASWKLDALNRERDALQRRLNELTPPLPPQPKHSVEEWLNLCRQGKVKTYYPGSDPNLDQAWRQYEEEKETIRDWAKKSATRKKVCGETLPLPEVAKHYSQARLREIVSATHPEAAKELFGYFFGY